MTELLARVRLDPAARRCLVRDPEVALRPKEFDLLAGLVAEPGRPSHARR